MDMSREQQPTEHPVFRAYTVSELAERTGYSEEYLCHVRAGRHPAGPRFRTVMVHCLKRTEEELFNGELLGTHKPGASLVARGEGLDG